MCIDLENVKNGRQYSKCLKSAIACRSMLYIMEEALGRLVKVGLWWCAFSLKKKLLSKLSSITQAYKWEPVEKNARANNEVEYYFIQGVGEEVVMLLATSCKGRVTLP